MLAEVSLASSHCSAAPTVAFNFSITALSEQRPRLSCGCEIDCFKAVIQFQLHGTDFHLVVLICGLKWKVLCSNQLFWWVVGRQCLVSWLSYVPAYLVLPSSCPQNPHQQP